MIGILKYFTFILTLMLHAYSLPNYTVNTLKNIKSYKCKHHIQRSPDNPVADS